MMIGRRWLALLLCAALWCGGAAAEEIIGAPVEAAVEEVGVALGDWPDAMPERELEAEIQAPPVDEAPGSECGCALEDSGLIVEYDDAAAAGRAVSAGEDAAGSISKDAGWSLSADGTLTITGTGRVDWTPWEYDADGAVRRLVVCEGITYLAQSAFINNATLKSVLLPATLEGVSERCFYGCTGLEEVTIAGGTQIGADAFRACTALRSVTLPEGLRTIGEYAFMKTALTSLRLPDSVESVGKYAFCDAPVERLEIGACLREIGTAAFANTALTALRLPGNVETVGEHAFSGTPLETVEIGDGVKQIGNSAFASTALTALRVPGSVETVGDNAFINAPIKVLEIGDGVKQLGECAFDGASPTALRIPGSIEEVDDGAFKDMPIETLEICEGVLRIGSEAFSGTRLTSLKLPDSLETVGISAFMDTPIETLEIGGGLNEIGASAFANTALTAVKLPGNVKNVGERAFLSAPVETLEIGDGVQQIGDSAFWGTKLTAVKLPDSVQTLGEGAFYNAPVETLEIGSGVRQIGKSAFAHSLLTEVRVPAGVQSIEEGAFNGQYLRTLVFEGAPRLCTGFARHYRYESAREMWFLGGVPQFEIHAFEGTDIVALYPGDDPAWTTEVRKAYGGKATWVNIDPSEVEAKKRPKTEKLKPDAMDSRGYGFRAMSVMDNGDGTYTRVFNAKKGIAVEVYNTAANKLIWKKTLKRELPLWGGCFRGSKYNFLIFGQINRNEKDSCEVVRVVRYTRNWNRVDATKVKGANTYYPLCEMISSAVESDDMLYLHTSHVMYVTSDGLNHQANFDIDINIPTMQATVIKGQMDNVSSGYVSHSFDQYIIEDDGDVIQMDLGDGYPRAVALYRRRGAAGSRVKSSIYGDSVNVLDIAGECGDNHTGVQLAGLEATGKYYIVAGVSESQKGAKPSDPQNVFVATVDKSDFTAGGVRLRWLTHYKSKDKRSLSEPHLVKLNGNRLQLMWTENGKKTRYLFLDGEGNVASPVYSVDGMSTGSNPIVSDSQVRWVYSDGDQLRLASVTAKDALPSPQIKAFENTEKGISIRWGKVKGATGYYVYRRTEGKRWSKLGTVKNATGFVDKSVKGGKRYMYIVRAYKGKTLSGYSDTDKPVIRLLAPAKVQISREDGVPKLSWKKVSGAEGYTVYRKAEGGKWKQIATKRGADSIQFYDWDTKKGKKYSYRVKAYSGDYTSAYSAATKATEL